MSYEIGARDAVLVLGIKVAGHGLKLQDALGRMGRSAGDAVKRLTNPKPNLTPLPEQAPLPKSPRSPMSRPQAKTSAEVPIERRGGWSSYRPSATTPRALPRTDPGTDFMQWSNNRAAARGAEAPYSQNQMNTYQNSYSPMTSARMRANPPSLGSYMNGVRAAGHAENTGRWGFPKEVWAGKNPHTWGGR